MPLFPILTAPDIHRSLDLDEGTLETVKASEGFLVGAWLSNLHATDYRYVKFYDSITGTIGTGTPKITVPVPPLTTIRIGVELRGLHFSTGISVGASTDFIDADVGAPGANEVIANIFYV